MQQDCFDLWRTDKPLTKLGRLISLATKASYELAWSYSYSCSFGSLTDADRQLVYHAARQVITSLRGTSFGKGGPEITFGESMDDAVARALVDTLCSYDGRLDDDRVCLPVHSGISPKEDAAVREVLSMIRASHEIMSTLGPFAFCPLPSGPELIALLGTYFPTEQWFLSQMAGRTECRPLVKSAAFQWLLNLREALVKEGATLSEESDLRAMQFRVATGGLIVLVQDSKVGPKIDRLFQLVADIVCDAKPHFVFNSKFSGAQDDPATVRNFMLNAIAGIFLDACAHMPPEMRQNSVAYPVHAMPAVSMMPAPVQTARRSLPGSLIT
jgi:hypothetical protein